MLHDFWPIFWAMYIKYINLWVNQNHLAPFKTHTLAARLWTFLGLLHKLYRSCWNGWPLCRAETHMPFYAYIAACNYSDNDIPLQWWPTFLFGQWWSNDILILLHALQEITQEDCHLCVTISRKKWCVENQQQQPEEQNSVELNLYSQTWPLGLSCETFHK